MIKPISRTQLRFDYTVDGISQSKTLTRFDFVSALNCSGNANESINSNLTNSASAGNRTDHWWNPQESGWGLMLIEQADIMFLTWYSYGSDGSPQWLTATLNRQDDGQFRGDLYRPVSGIRFDQINGNAATSFPVPSVGTANLGFINGRQAVFRYNLSGPESVTQQKNIERFVFAGANSICQ